MGGVIEGGAGRRKFRMHRRLSTAPYGHGWVRWVLFDGNQCKTR